MEEIATQLGSGRMAEIFYCLIQVAPTVELKNRIMQYAKDLNKEREEELASSDDSVCLTAILRVFNLGWMQSSLILIKDIAEEINKELPYAEQWTHRRVGSLCSRLGFKKQTNRQKLTCIKWDSVLVDALKKDSRYKVCFQAEEASPPTPKVSPSSSKPPEQDWLQTAHETH